MEGACLYVASPAGLRVDVHMAISVKSGTRPRWHDWDFLQVS